MIALIVIGVAIILFYIFAGLTSPIYSFAFLGLVLAMVPNWGWTIRWRLLVGFLFMLACGVLHVILFENDPDYLGKLKDYIDDLIAGEAWPQTLVGWLGTGPLIDLREELGEGYFKDYGGDFWILSLVNFALFAAYILLMSLVLGSILWLINKSMSFLSRASDGVDPYARAAVVANWADAWLAKQRSGAQRWIYIVSGVVAVLLIGLLPFWLELFPLFAVGLGQQASFLWVGPLVFVLELVRNALKRNDETEVSIWKALFRRTEKAEHPIRPAFDQFLDNYRDHVMAFEIPSAEEDKLVKQKNADPKETQVRHRDLVTLRANLDRFGKPGTDYRAVWVKETLTSAHFDVMVELLQKHAFDSGGAAWIICPDHAVEECENYFQRASMQTGTRFLQNWQSLRHVRGENRPIDVLIGSIEDYEREISNARVSDNLSRLSAVFILQLEQIDSGLLKIMGARIRARFKAFDTLQDNLLLWVQSENQKRTSDRVEQLFFTVGKQIVRELDPVQTDARGDRFFLIWNPTDALDDRLHQHVLNSDRLRRAMAKIMIQTWMVDPAYGCYVADPDGQFHHRFWRGTLPSLVRSVRIGDGTVNQELNQRFEELPSFQVVPPMLEAPIAFVEDHGNLATALSLGVRGHSVPEVMTHVLQANYPFATVIRRFIETRFLDEKASEQLDTFRIVDDLNRVFGRVAPKPSGGLVELALLIAAELLADSEGSEGGVLQSRIDEFFAIVGVRDHILQPLGISPTRQGLIRLFELTQGVKPDLKVRRLANYEPAYSLSSTEIYPRLRYYGVRTDSQGSSRSDAASLPVADFGLSYDQGTLLRRGGSQYRVSEVIVSKNEVTEQTDNDASAVEASFVFQRGYVLGGLEQELLLQEGDDAEDVIRSTLQRNFAVQDSRVKATGRNLCDVNLINVVAERRTFRSAAVSTFRTDDPLAAADEKPATARSPRSLRNALHLRFVLPDHDNDEPELLRRLSLTLATTLQDTLALLFPRHAHRIAVVSPQSIGLRTELNMNIGDGALDKTTNFALFRQPFLSMAREVDSDRREILPDDAGNQGQMRIAYNLLGRLIAAKASEVRSDGGHRGPERSTIDLYVVEDSDHDLGVARALFDESLDHDVADPWRRLLDHMRNASGRGEYYAFGDDGFPDVYVFDAASNVLRGIWGTAKE